MDLISPSIKAAQEQLSGLSSIPRSTKFVLIGLVSLVTIGLLVYAQTIGFVWDEGFHLLAAQLISRGRVPYIDFCFPQTPLNAYWNALCLKMFGQGWRATHIFPALFVSGSGYLSADYILRRFPLERWRIALAITVVLTVALNDIAVQFGTVAQAYGIGMFFSVAAFRFCVNGVSDRSWRASFGAGTCAGIAAASSLLTAPLAPVLLAWQRLYNTTGNRWRQAAAFVAGYAIPFAPVLWLFAKAPRQTWFNVVQYQALFRSVNWGDATIHDIDTVTAWLNSTPAFMTGMLAIAGIVFLRKRSNWDQQLRAEFYLSASIAVALTVYIAIAHPTFQRYFVFAVPFYCILAAVGLYAVGSRLSDSGRPFWPACVVSALMLLSIAKEIFNERDLPTWKTYEEMAAKIRQVTPPGSIFYADEHIYFLLGRTPPPGMEFSYAHKLELPKSQELLYHVVSQKELDQQVEAGKFATVETCKDDVSDEMNLPKLFAKQQEFGDCTVFWGWNKAQSATGKK